MSTFAAEKHSDREIGMTVTFLVKLFETMWDIFKECPNDRMKVFMININ